MTSGCGSQEEAAKARIDLAKELLRLEAMPRLEADLKALCDKSKRNARNEPPRRSWRRCSKRSSKRRANGRSRRRRSAPTCELQQSAPLPSSAGRRESMAPSAVAILRKRTRFALEIRGHGGGGKSFRNSSSPKGLKMPHLADSVVRAMRGQHDQGGWLWRPVANSVACPTTLNARIRQFHCGLIGNNRAGACDVRPQQ